MTDTTAPCPHDDLYKPDCGECGRSLHQSVCRKCGKIIKIFRKGVDLTKKGRDGVEL